MTAASPPLPTAAGSSCASHGEEHLASRRCSTLCGWCRPPRRPGWSTCPYGGLSPSRGRRAGRPARTPDSHAMSSARPMKSAGVLHRVVMSSSTASSGSAVQTAEAAASGQPHRIGPHRGRFNHRCSLPGWPAATRTSSADGAPHVRGLGYGGAPRGPVPGLGDADALGLDAGMRIVIAIGVAADGWALPFGSPSRSVSESGLLEAARTALSLRTG